MPGESIYLGVLVLVFLEGVFEAVRAQERLGDPFATPDKTWIRWNLFLDIVVILLVVAFQGVNQERLFTFYVLPVLASAFYLGTVDILGVALFTAASHIVMVLCFDAGWLPPSDTPSRTLGATLRTRGSSFPSPRFRSSRRRWSSCCSAETSNAWTRVLSHRKRRWTNWRRCTGAWWIRCSRVSSRWMPRVASPRRIRRRLRSFETPLR